MKAILKAAFLRGLKNNSPENSPMLAETCIKWTFIC